jgi:hypothetical protein
MKVVENRYGHGFVTLTIELSKPTLIALIKQAAKGADPENGLDGIAEDVVAHLMGYESDHTLQGMTLFNALVEEVQKYVEQVAKVVSVIEVDEDADSLG